MNHLFSNYNQPLLRKIFLSTIFIALLAIAWNARFILDDAYIYFRYAENAVNGNGLVWNIGERVEGYTGFSWLILLTIPFYLNISPEVFTLLISLILYMGSLVSLYFLSISILKSRILAVAVLLVTGINSTFYSFATGGLETPLQTFLFLQIVLVWIRLKQKPHLRTNSIVTIHYGMMAVLIMTRLDSILLLIPLVINQNWSCFTSQNKRFLYRELRASLPGMLIIGNWFLWKYSYYGNVLPNTFYAKTGDLNSLKHSITYVGLFLMSFNYIPLLITFIYLRLKRIIPVIRSEIVTLLSIIVAWLIYISVVGGHMQFRLFSPIIPLLSILFIWTITELKDSTLKPLYLVLVFTLLISGSWVQTYLFKNKLILIQSTTELDKLVSKQITGWKSIGHALKNTFGENDITIATTASGAIPYFSGYRAIDMHGLTDNWIAHNGLATNLNFGHQLVAPLSYLNKRNVNILIGQPIIETSQSIESLDLDINTIEAYLFIKSPLEISDATLLAIRLSQNKYLITLYLTKSITIDNLLLSARCLQMTEMEPFNRICIL